MLAFSLNNGTLIGSDSEGFHRLTVISENRMESCFTDNGGGSIFASCGLIEKRNKSAARRRIDRMAAGP